jgi:hypothetical protein
MTSICAHRSSRVGPPERPVDSHGSRCQSSMSSEPADVLAGRHLDCWRCHVCLRTGRRCCRVITRRREQFLERGLLIPRHDWQSRHGWLRGCRRPTWRRRSASRRRASRCCDGFYLCPIEHANSAVRCGDRPELVGPPHFVTRLRLTPRIAAASARVMTSAAEAQA